MYAYVCVLAPLLSFLHAMLCTNDDMLIIISIYLYRVSKCKIPLHYSCYHQVS